MPLFHIHGLVAALLVVARGGRFGRVLPGFQAADVPRWIDDLDVTWTTAVPTMHQALLERLRRDPAAAPRRRLRFLRSSSAPLPPRSMRRVESAFGARSSRPTA